MTPEKFSQFAAMLVIPPKSLAPAPKRMPLGANPKKRVRREPAEPVASTGLVAAPTRNWKQGEYKHSPAMRISLDRAHAAQPPLVALAASPADDSKYERY